MSRTLHYAAQHGVTVGAHVAYRDLAGFGRRFMDIAADELTADVMYQIAALEGIAQSVGTSVRYVKPHGALYNRIVRDREQAQAVVRAIVQVNPNLAVLTQSGAVVAQIAHDNGLRVFYEAFADRAYHADGTLVSRSVDGAVIDDPDIIAQRVVRMVCDHEVVTIDGDTIALHADSVCVHGDTPAAVVIAQTIRAQLEAAGVTIASFISTGHED